MTTLNNLQDDVLFNTFDDAKYRGRSTRYLNRAVEKVARTMLYGWSQEFVDVDDDGVAALPSRYSIIQSVWSASPGPTDAVGDLLTPGGDYSAPAGLPDWDPPYLSETVGFWFYADGPDPQILVPSHLPRVRVDGYRLPAAMADATDDSGLPDAADDALITYARAKLYKLEDDFEAHAALMTDFARELADLASRRPRRSGPAITPGTWADGYFGAQ